MAIRNPTFNLKTGADSDLIVAREVTENNQYLGKIKRKDGLFTFPYLTRRTGDTLTGTTENIESNELRHGRTKSAPRKGTSSSSGDINFEFSAVTFDDMMEAAFRGKWKRWKSDTTSDSNKQKNAYAPGYFATKCASDASGKKLIYDATGTGDDEGLIHVDGNNKAGFIIHELNSGTEDIKYSLLRKYGGQTGEDLWQEFTHCAINTMQLSVEINSIITGSFGIMGTNNPKIRNSEEVIYEFQDRVKVAYSDRDKGAWTTNTAYKTNDVVTYQNKWYRAKAAIASAASFTASNWYEFDSREDALNVTYVDKGEFSTASTYAINDAVLYNGKWYGCVATVGTAGAWDADDWLVFDSEEYFASIPDHATNTVQFTAREGFLYINGKQIEFAQSLSFTLDNGLTQKFAIFVPNAISTVPLELNINGDLSTYLVGGESDAKKLFNDAVDDKDVELLWCFQNKLENPTELYVFQIFSAKHTENTINGNGSDTYDESLPWQSFGEQACRVFRIAYPKIMEAFAAHVDTTLAYADTVVLSPNVELELGDLDVYDASTKPNGLDIKIKKNGTDVNFAAVIGNKRINPTSGNVEIVANDGTTDVSSTANVILDLVEGSDTYGQILVTTGVDPETYVVALTATWHDVEYAYSYDASN